MGAFDGLNAFFNGEIVNYAIRYEYDESNIIILKGDRQELERHHLQAYQNLLSCRHHSDNRTPIQYGQDLVASWVFEDYFLNEMINSGFSIDLAGADRNRTILPNQRTSTSSDYTITTPAGSVLNMELVNDYTGFWARTHTLHLRDNKYVQLQRNRCLLLAIALTANVKKYALFDFREDIPAQYIQSHRPYGNKPAYELRIPQDMLCDFSIDDIKQRITNVA
ncbi:MAG: hypothetical protein K6F86_06955 [Lachnospiraceae bacterium]|nr:hypothetical protein [Lachnospiraceae bacterium]